MSVASAIIPQGQLLNVALVSRYKIGETFVHLPLARAQKRIAKDQEDLDRRIEALNERTATHEGEMKDLKIQLYAKFGRQINLD